MKRILLFLSTNIAVMAVITIISRIFGLDNYLNEYGIDYKALAIYSFIWGSAGSIIALFMSKSAAKRTMGVSIIEHPSNETEMWLVETVRRQAKLAGIGMPEVGIFESETPNAFATGANRNNALVAMSTGLLNQMTREEAEAVMGHEISHVANGDMITMTLIQGILNAFVLFFSRIIGFVMSSSSKGRSHSTSRAGSFIGTMVAQFVLGFLAALIIKWFSRYREFRADEGGANLSSTTNMINALKALQRVSQPQPLKGQFVGFGVSGVKSTVAKLFSTHPPLEDRIKALENTTHQRQR